MPILPSPLRRDVAPHPHVLAGIPPLFLPPSPGAGQAGGWRAWARALARGRTPAMERALLALDRRNGELADAATMLTRGNRHRRRAAGMLADAAFATLPEVVSTMRGDPSIYPLALLSGLPLVMAGLLYPSLLPPLLVGMAAPWWLALRGAEEHRRRLGAALGEAAKRPWGLGESLAGLPRGQEGGVEAFRTFLSATPSQMRRVRLQGMLALLHREDPDREYAVEAVAVLLRTAAAHSGGRRPAPLTEAERDAVDRAARACGLGGSPALSPHPDRAPF